MRISSVLPAACLGAMVVLIAGCDRSAVRGPGNEPDSTPAGGLAESDVWLTLHLGGARVGRVHWTTEPVERDGQSLLLSKRTMVLAVQRGADATSSEVETESLVRPGGALVRYREKQQFGGSPQTAAGRVEGGTLVIERPGVEAKRFDWPADGGGPEGVELSLLAAPMSPGERRSLTILAPVFHVPATVTLAAQDWEEIDGKRLLRIQSVGRLPSGQSLSDQLWTDEQGVIWKQLSVDSGVETVRASRAAALGADEVALDLAEFTTVRVARPPADPRSARRVVYRITLEGGRAADVFVGGPMQSVEPQPNGDVLVAVDPSIVAAAPAPDAAALGASPIVQTRDPAIQSLAAKATGAASGAPLAAGITDFVHRHIRVKDYSQAFASAAEAAETRRGDCTEHSVLAAALARARGLPTRAAMGLVYLGDRPAFGFHMWNEFYLDGAWRPYDATLGSVGPGHIKVSDSLLGGDSEFEGLLPIAGLLGRLSIEIVEVE